MLVPAEGIYSKEDDCLLRITIAPFRGCGSRLMILKAAGAIVNDAISFTYRLHLFEAHLLKDILCLYSPFARFGCDTPLYAR